MSRASVHSPRNSSLTYSIAHGIGLGFVAYIAIMALTGRAREVKPLMWVSGLAFLAMFIVG